MINRHMKRKLRALGLATAMFTVTAQISVAAITPASVVSSYQAEGYSRVEVDVGVNQMKVEAIKGSVKVETIYDIATGAVLKTETEAVEAGDDTAPGTSIRQRNRDFLDAGNSDDDDRGRGGDDDDSDKDDDHGRGGDDDDSDEDDDHGRGGDDDDDGDDSDDDNGSDDD